MTDDLYDRDFYAWATEQAALLRSGKLASVDIEHVAEEIESMGRSERRELISRLTVLLQHLLKWQFQPARRGASWQATITNTRRDLADHLQDNPSLRPKLPDAIARSYSRAILIAAAETGLMVSAFPPSSPYSEAEIMDEEYWPS